MYLIACGVWSVISAVLIFLGCRFYRLPEMLIVSCSVFIILISVFLLDIYLDNLKDKDKIARAGRVYAEVECLCKYNAKTSAAVILLCKKGVLIQGDSFDSELMLYNRILVDYISRFDMQITSGRNIYDITLGSVLDAKTVKRVLDSKSVSEMPAKRSEKHQKGRRSDFKTARGKD